MIINIKKATVNALIDNCLLASLNPVARIGVVSTALRTGTPKTSLTSYESTQRRSELAVTMSIDLDETIDGVEQKYYLAAQELQHHLFDTEPPGSCNHGALPSTDPQRKEHDALHVLMYFANRAKDEDEGAPTGFTNHQFLLRLGPHLISESLSALVLSDAANHALRGDYSSAKLMARIHMNFDVYLKNGKPPVPTASSPEMQKLFVEGGKGKIPTFMQQISHLMNSVETPAEVTEYIAAHLPCACLSSSFAKKAAAAVDKYANVGECHHCRKKGPARQFKRCSKCKSAFYCGRECQVAAWPAHKARCRQTMGKAAKLEDVKKFTQDFMEKHEHDIEGTRGKIKDLYK